MFDIYTKKIKVNGINISYAEFGQGNPLILIMGSGGTLDMWDSTLLANLSKTNRVIIFDNRGVGNSTKNKKTFSIPLFAKDTLALMNKLKLPKASLLGWSMGSYIAQEIAISSPKHVNKLVLLAGDCGGREQIPPDNDVTQKLLTSLKFSAKTLTLIPLLFPKKWFLEHPLQPLKIYLQIHESSSLNSLKAQKQAMDNWRGSFSRLSLIHQDTLIITGRKDLITPPQNSKILQAKIPHAKLRIFNNGGHCLMYQYPTKLSKIITAFLK